MTIIDIARLLGEERKARAVTYLFLRKMQGENVADAQAGADEQHAVRLAVLEAKYELLKAFLNDHDATERDRSIIHLMVTEDSHDDPRPHTDQEPASTTAPASDTDGAGPDCGD